MAVFLKKSKIVLTWYLIRNSHLTQLRTIKGNFLVIEKFILNIAEMLSNYIISNILLNIIDFKGNFEEKLYFLTLYPREKFLKALFPL